MVTRTSINRLSAEIDALAAKLQGKKPFIVFFCPEYLDPKDVEKRHYELFPEDRGAELAVFIRRLFVEEPAGEPTKFDAAWRDLIRQETVSLPPDELKRKRALAMIRKSVLGFEGETQPCGYRSRAGWVGLIVGRYDFPADEAIQLMREAGIPVDDDFVMRGFREAVAEERKAA